MKQEAGLNIFLCFSGFLMIDISTEQPYHVVHHSRQSPVSILIQWSSGGKNGWGKDITSTWVPKSDRHHVICKALGIPLMSIIFMKRIREILRTSQMPWCHFWSFICKWHPDIAHCCLPRSLLSVFSTPPPHASSSNLVWNIIHYCYLSLLTQCR